MGGPKQFIKLCGIPMAVRTCRVFEEYGAVDEIVLVVGSGDIHRAKESVESYSLKKVKDIIAGGKTRQDSVYNGLQAISQGSDCVLIHDGARPLITKDLILKVVSELKNADAVVLGVPVTDTIKEVKDGCIISETLERGVLWAAQTPQAFKASLIRQAHEEAKKGGYSATDDSSLMEKLGHKVKIIMGSYDNVKITTPEDLTIAECIIRSRGKRSFG